MYKLCKTEQSAFRQRQLEQQLLQMMNAVRYEDITISDFCLRAGIPRKAFYRYFSGKDGALHALIDHTLLECESLSVSEKPYPRDLYQKELSGFFQFWKQQKPLLDALTTSGISGVLVTRTIDYVLADSQPAWQHLSPDERKLRECGTTFAVCGIMAIVLNWYQSGYQASADRMARITEELLTQPVLQTEER